MHRDVRLHQRRVEAVENVKRRAGPRIDLDQTVAVAGLMKSALHKPYKSGSRRQGGEPAR